MLSGTGADGTIGLAAIKAAGGLVIAQDPVETDYDGMLRNGKGRSCAARGGHCR